MAMEIYYCMILRNDEWYFLMLLFLTLYKTCGLISVLYTYSPRTLGHSKDKISDCLLSQESVCQPFQDGIISMFSFELHYLPFSLEDLIPLHLHKWYSKHLLHLEEKQTSNQPNNPNLYLCKYKIIFCKQNRLHHCIAISLKIQMMEIFSELSKFTPPRIPPQPPT